MMPNKGIKKGFIQYFKYALIGLSCAAIDLGVLNGLLYFFPTEHRGLLTLYNSIAYGLAVLNSYIWNSRFTFKEGSTHSSKQFFYFIIQSVVSLIISDAVFVGGVDLLKAFSLPTWLRNNIAKLTSMFLSSIASFFFNKYFVFRSQKEPSGNEESSNKLEKHLTWRRSH